MGFVQRNDKRMSSLAKIEGTCSYRWNVEGEGRLRDCLRRTLEYH